MTETEPLQIKTADELNLEAELARPDDPSVVAVLSHPHPLYGGNMWSTLIEDLFWALPAAGVAAIRFNFRSAGASEGSHGGGAAERQDVWAAVEAAKSVAPTVVSVGWSFGADVSLSTEHPALASWVGVAPPLALLDPTEMPAATDVRPKLLLIPEHDNFCPPETAKTRSSDWPSTTFEVIPGADHFLAGHSNSVAEKVLSFV